MTQLDERLRRFAPPRIGPFRPGVFRGRLHQERAAAWLGVALGVSFTVCFLTGLLSHLIQHPPQWFAWPSRPAWVYRVTQGAHVATGIASIPLLLAKLWVVYPRFWTWPPFRSAGHLVERITLFFLVGGSLFMLFTGLGSIARFRPWSFSFPAAHYSASWITIGALVAHVGAKLHVAARALAREDRAARTAGARGDPVGTGTLSRRGFLGAVAAAVGAVTIATVGQTVRPLAAASVLAPRDPRLGPQGVPVNRTARSAGVTQTARAPDFRLTFGGNVPTPLELTLDELRALPQREAVLAIACVDGWSATATWRGVPVRDLLSMAGAPEGSAATVASLQAPGTAYASSELEPSHAWDPDTLLALELNGEVLHIDHGFPVRLIGPNRPGVMQTKWVHAVSVT